MAAGLQILLNQLQQAISISALNLQCSVSNRAGNLPLAATLKGSSMDSQNAGLQINQSSQCLTTSHSACVLEELPPAEGLLPVITINHQIIRHVYRRREGGKTMKAKLIFSASSAISALAKGKRSAAVLDPLLSDDGLRRSPRLKELYDGRKAQSAGKKCSCCKETTQPQSRTKPKIGRSHFDIRLPNLVANISFPSMDDLLERSDQTFPEILVTEL
jgi:hypothetical protein